MNKILFTLFLILSIPLFIGSIENANAAAVRTIIDNPGFATNVLEDNPGDGTDDGFASASIGFAVNFFGSFFNDIFVNNNGNNIF